MKLMRQISTGRVFAHDPHFLERDDFEEFDDEAQDPKPEEQAASDDAPKRRGRPPKSPE